MTVEYCVENWTHVYKSGKLNSCFLISRIGTHNSKSRESEMPCREPWAKKFSKILPQGMFKTRLDTFGNDFGHFLNFETFLIFLKFLEGPTLHVTRGNYFSKKIAAKHVQNNFGQFWKRFWAFLQFLIFFDFFETFGWLHWILGKKQFSKKSPQNTFGHLGTVLDKFRTLNFFDFFLEFFLSLYLKI